jgi:voltage-gated potassium channel
VSQKSTTLGIAIRIVAVLAAMPMIGTAGFVLIEDWPVFDALYMSMITLSTVGYGEIRPLSTAGRTFVMFYLTLGLGTFLFSLAQFGEMIVRAELKDWLGRRRMDSKLKTMSNHFIVCGAGRVGSSICQYLTDRSLPFVILEKDEALVGEFQTRGWPYLIGDATDDKTLITAGIERARGLAAVLSGDADNVYVVLSARMLSKTIQIISRASSDKSENKLKKAGADRVVSIYASGAHRMAQFMTNNKVHEFVEIFNEKENAIDMAEIQISNESRFAGKRLDQTDFRKQGIIIVGLRRPQQPMLIPPPPTEVIAAGDSLLAVGKADAISALSKTA